MARLPPLQEAPPVQRCERLSAGELLHLVAKQLARFDQPGHRVAGDRTGYTSGAGWRYYSYYKALGVKVQRVMTDNGSAYQSRRFAELLQRLKIKHLRTRPYTPRANGKAERFIHTLLREWA